MDSFFEVELETRQDSQGRSVYAGRFPYGSYAVMADRGTVRKETFESHAFEFAINDETRRIDFLAGHSFDRVLASRSAGTFQIQDTAEAVLFEATLPIEAAQTSWQRDFALAHSQGLVRGISPGFTVPPRGVVPGAERLIPEAGNPAVQVRSINAAVLYEVSAVTRPAYPATDLEARAEQPTGPYWQLDREMLRWL